MNFHKYQSDMVAIYSLIPSYPFNISYLFRMKYVLFIASHYPWIVQDILNISVKYNHNQSFISKWDGANLYYTKVLVSILTCTCSSVRLLGRISHSLCPARFDGLVSAVTCRRYLIYTTTKKIIGMAHPSNPRDRIPKKSPNHVWQYIQYQDWKKIHSIS
jgi:hypothetical protein